MDLPPYLIALGLFRCCELTAALVVLRRFRASPTGILAGSAFTIWLLAGALDILGIYLGYSEAYFDLSDLISRMRPLFTAIDLIAYTLLLFAILFAPTAAGYRLGGKGGR